MTDLLTSTPVVAATAAVAVVLLVLDMRRREVVRVARNPGPTLAGPERPAAVVGPHGWFGILLLVVFLGLVVLRFATLAH